MIHDESFVFLVTRFRGLILQLTKKGRHDMHIVYLCVCGRGDLFAINTSRYCLYMIIMYIVV